MRSKSNRNKGITGVNLMWLLSILGISLLVIILSIMIVIRLIKFSLVRTTEAILRAGEHYYARAITATEFYSIKNVIDLNSDSAYLDYAGKKPKKGKIYVDSFTGEVYIIDRFVFGKHYCGYSDLKEKKIACSMRKKKILTYTVTQLDY